MGKSEITIEMLEAACAALREELSAGFPADLRYDDSHPADRASACKLGHSQPPSPMGTHQSRGARTARIAWRSNLDAQ
jgi:hypothetical protein